MLITERVSQHLLVLGFPQTLVEPFSRRLSRWCQESGLEWTVKRLKSLHEYHLQVLSGLNPPIPLGWSTRRTRTRVTFKDPLVRYVFDLPLNGKTAKKKENFLRMYKVIKLRTLSKSQERKFRLNLESEYSGSDEALAEAVEAIEKGLKLLMGRIDPKSIVDTPFAPLRVWPPADKSAPTLVRSSLKAGKPKVISVSRNHAFARDFVDHMRYDRDFQSLWRAYPFDVSRCMVGDGEAIPIYHVRETIDLPIGRIGFIQEGGAKLRSIANPFLSVQALGEPLKRKLEAITKRLPVIGSFDQDSSHNRILGWISLGREVHSYDLSAFTDRFPWHLQEYVLRRLKEQGYISQFDYDTFSIVVRKGWLLPGTTNQVHWKVGQPLGFGPSFHLATLTHAALVRGLGGRDYQVVGDDVAIADRVPAQRYHSLITSLGVEISTSKSIVSSEYAEFCGKLIGRWGITPSIKLSLISGAAHIVDLFRFYGSRAFSHLSHKERKWALKVLLPEDLGGLGWSPPGTSYPEYLAALKTDRIALHRLRNDLSSFLKLDTIANVDPYEWIATFDTVNNLTIKDHDLSALSGLSPKGMTGIAASNLLTHNRSGPSPNGAARFEPYRTLMDRETRRDLAKLSRLPKNLMSYINNLGIIDPRQKECDLPMPILWSDDNGNSHNHHNKYFHPSARELLAKG